MEADHHVKSVPVDHELTFFGRPARVLIEIELHRNGATALIPVGDATFVRSGAISEIRIPLRGAVLRRVADAEDQAGMIGLDG